MIGVGFHSVAAPSGTGVTDLTIEQLLLPSPTPPPPLLPMVDDQNDSWWQGRPVWEAQSRNIGATFWAAASPTAFRFHVVVHADKQTNSYHERNLWRGDCIYISLDARGDDPPGKPQPLEPDDAVFIFGLGVQGPECRVSHGNPVEQKADSARFLKSILRNEDDKTTTYEIVIPYSAVGTAVGQTPTAGLAVCIAHKNDEEKDLTWGRITGDARTPRELHVFALPAPAHPFISTAPFRTRLVQDTDTAMVTIAFRTEGEAVIEASLGGRKLTKTFRGDGSVQRFAIRVHGAAVRPGADSLDLTLSATATPGVTAHYALSTPAVVMSRLQARIEKLLAGAPNALVRDNLQATLALVQESYRCLPLEKPDHPERAGEFIDNAELILRKLPFETVDWQDHIRKCIPLAFTFISDVDRTLQYYSLQMPFDYQEGRTYPLTIYLHGMGDDNPLGGLTSTFDNSSEDTLFRTVDIDPSNIPPSHRGFVLAPWARGNSMYRGAGESDVWQSIARVKQRFQIDPDRVYLTGFSMGCSGVMGLAGRHPDVFAGLNLASGFGPWSETSQIDLINHLRNMPMAVWVGELDPMAGAATAFHEQLGRQGISHRFEIAKQLPHTYPYLEYQKNVGYLMTFRRKAEGVTPVSR